MNNRQKKAKWNSVGIELILSKASMNKKSYENIISWSDSVNNISIPSTVISSSQ